MPDQPDQTAPFNLAAHVLREGQSCADKTALEIHGPDGADCWSYRRLIDATRGTATGLLELGLRPGDRVLMRLGNSVEFPLAYLGAIAAGLVPIPTSAQLSRPEITRIAKALDPALVIAGPGIACPDLPAPVLSADDLHRFHHLPPADWHRGDPDRPAYIILTSGTSGQTRAVVHAHRAILARRMMWDGWYGLRADDRLLHAGAFNWTYTLGTGLMDPWSIGATALIPRAGTASTDLPALLDRSKATIFAAAPGVYRQILRSDMPGLPALRHGLSAGEKLPETLRAAWRTATGREVHEAFGMSECSTFISGNPDRPAPPDTLGWPQNGRRIALLDDNGATVAPGAPGIIAIHRDDPGLMLGYHGDPEATANRFAGDWFLTGDLACETEAGALRYLGRNDDMMNAGGIRVSPIEVETALTDHPGVTEAAACEVRVGPETTVIAAFWSGPAPIAEGQLRAFAAERLASYKLPRLFVRVDHLPRGANNKLLRRALRQDWEKNHGQT